MEYVETIEGGGFINAQFVSRPFLCTEIHTFHFCFWMTSHLIYAIVLLEIKRRLSVNLSKTFVSYGERGLNWHIL